MVPDIGQAIIHALQTHWDYVLKILGVGLAMQGIQMAMEWMNSVGDRWDQEAYDKRFNDWREYQPAEGRKRKVEKIDVWDWDAHERAAGAHEWTVDDDELDAIDRRQERRYRRETGDRRPRRQRKRRG